MHCHDPSLVVITKLDFLPGFVEFMLLGFKANSCSCLFCLTLSLSLDETPLFLFHFLPISVMKVAPCC